MCDIVLVPHPSAQLRNPVQRGVTQGVFSASFLIPPASEPTPAIACGFPKPDVLHCHEGAWGRCQGGGQKLLCKRGKCYSGRFYSETLLTSRKCGNHISIAYIFCIIFWFSGPVLSTFHDVLDTSCFCLPCISLLLVTVPWFSSWDLPIILELCNIGAL